MELLNAFGIMLWYKDGTPFYMIKHNIDDEYIQYPIYAKLVKDKCPFFKTENYKVIDLKKDEHFATIDTRKDFYLPDVEKRLHYACFTDKNEAMSYFLKHREAYIDKDIKRHQYEISQLEKERIQLFNYIEDET